MVELVIELTILHLLSSIVNLNLSYQLYSETIFYESIDLTQNNTSELYFQSEKSFGMLRTRAFQPYYQILYVDSVDHVDITSTLLH